MFCKFISDSVETDTSNSMKPSYKPRASSDSEIFMNPEKIPSLKVLSSLKKQNNLSDLNNDSSIETELKFWNSGINKYLSPQKKIVTSSIKKTRSQTEYNFTTFSEQHVQTTEKYNSSLDTNEKYVQTDFPLVKWVTAVMKQEKSLRKYVEKETNTDMDTRINNGCISNHNLRNITDPRNQEILPYLANILDINEIDNIISSLLYSPLKMLQCKHMNKLSGGNIGNTSGYVNLIIRQSDFMPLLVSGIEERANKTCKQFFPADCICFPYIYNVKQITSEISLKYDKNDNGFSIQEKKYGDISLKQYSTEDYSEKSGQTEFSVQCENTENNKTSRVLNTLQIDYKNPQTSGRIILTEFGDTQSSAQSEMISRILTHLIGLPNSKMDDK